MTARLLIVVSGLAASGKTTVGRLLSRDLSLPLLDKDDILEALFDSLGCEDRDRRHQLSRASDAVLFRVAAASDACGRRTGPLRLGGPLVTVDTSGPVDEVALLDTVRGLQARVGLARDAPPG